MLKTKCMFLLQQDNHLNNSVKKRVRYRFHNNSSYKGTCVVDAISVRDNRQIKTFVVTEQRKTETLFLSSVYTLWF